jgi:hypothetical protein
MATKPASLKGSGRSRRWLLIVLVVLAAIVAGGFVAVNAILGSDRVRSTLEQKLAEYLAQPVRVGSAGAGLFPPAVELRDVTVGPPGLVQLGEIRVKTGLRALLSRRIEDAEVVISKSRVTWPLPFQIGGAAPAAAKPGDAGSGGLEVASIKVIEARDVEVVSGRETLRVDLDASVHGDSLQIVRLVARTKTTRIESHGALTSLARLQGRLDATADPLNLDEMIALATALTAAPPESAARKASARPAAAAPIRLKVKLTSPKGSFAVHQFQDLSAEADIEPARFALTSIGVRALGGTFKGRLDADTARPVPVLRLTGAVAGLDMVEVMKATGSPGSVTGRLGGTVALTAEGTDANTLMRTARGTIAAVVTDGTLPGLDMVRPIVLAFGKPSGAPPAGSGSAFSRIAGSFALANETLTSENLTLASRDFDMDGRGTLRLAAGDVNATSNVVLSAELTSQAGTDLRRYAQENGRITVPATVRGPLSRPDVFIDAGAAIRRAFSNEVQRRASDFIGGLFKKKKNE